MPIFLIGLTDALGDMLMYKNGIPISNVKDFLGLSDISTTSRYAYADNEDIKKALETVQEKLSH